ncbi:hypothetical protein [Gilliamella sp. wkB108]|uniref:hypothetical protein n=1 Tax=Gilliamella sp. wkB108 TaxID=3120256 RepID=UPI001C3FFCBA|nr:hypothetical protein [Gilliamella apicola]
MQHQRLWQYVSATSPSQSRKATFISNLISFFNSIYSWKDYIKIGDLNRVIDI